MDGVKLQIDTRSENVRNRGVEDIAQVLSASLGEKRRNKFDVQGNTCIVRVINRKCAKNKGPPLKRVFGSVVERISFLEVLLIRSTVCFDASNR